MLSFKELCAKFDRKQPRALGKLLKARGIRYMLDGKGRPVTTEDAINRALFDPRRTITFTKPLCRRSSRSRPESVRNTGPGITSSDTSGESYAG